MTTNTTDSISNYRVTRGYTTSRSALIIPFGSGFAVQSRKIAWAYVISGTYPSIPEAPTSPTNSA